MKTYNALLSVSVLVLLLISQALAAPPGGHLNITQVLVDDPNNPASIMISGEDFSFGPGPLVVTLGNATLTVVEVVDVTPTDTMIEALLPAGLPSGDYLLTVSMGNGQSENDEYDLTIGAVGPQGEQGIQGDQGIQGEQGPQGEPGQDGAQGTDGATGDDGADGPPGAAGLAGPPGEPGEPGPQGEAGNLALAGFTCAPNEFVSGFDALGNLICQTVDSLPPAQTPQGSSEGELLSLVFSGVLGTRPGAIGTVFEGFGGGNVSGMVQMDLRCSSKTALSTDPGCFSFFRAVITSPDGDVVTIELPAFIIQTGNFGTSDGANLLIGADSPVTDGVAIFTMFFNEHFDDDTTIPSVEFLNAGETLTNASFNVGSLLDPFLLAGPLAYSFSSSGGL